MRILFAGTPALAVPPLRAAANVCEVAAVLTSRDMPAGRGRAIAESDVKREAVGLGLPVLQPARLDAVFVEEVRALAPQLLVVVAYGRIFRQSFLDLFPLGGINLHPSLLPRHRGPSPLSAAILAGDAETGVTIQRLAKRFDTGDILGQARIALDGTETTGSLSERLSSVGSDLMVSVLQDLAAGKPLAETVQDDALATYCTPIRKDDGIIRWSDPAASVERAVRAYDPWPRARTTLNGQTLLVLKSHVYPDTLPLPESGEGDAASAEGANAVLPGTVLAVSRGHGLLVRCGRGVLAVERLQLPFKKPLDWRSFLNGHPETIGAPLGARAEGI